VVGHDQDNGDQLRAIEFDRIKGGKRFDLTEPGYVDLLARIGQPETPLLPAEGHI
jgi:pyrophosphate--fructose-6-phosphate 1-phosphotransferase